MGCGKSTVGMLLSGLLGLPRVDTDYIIEQKEKMSTSEIFAKKGEDYFRKKETKLIFRLSHQTPRIVSLGGGSVMAQKNVKIMKKKGVIIFLNASFDDIYERVRRNDKRPLAKSRTKEELLELYNKRLPVYRLAADIEIDGLVSAKETAEKIYEILKEKGIIEENKNSVMQ